MFRTIVSAALLCALATSLPLFADVLVLNDGREYRGTVISEDENIIRFEAHHHGMRMTVKVPRGNVHSLQQSNDISLAVEEVGTHNKVRDVEDSENDDAVDNLTSHMAFDEQEWRYVQAPDVVKQSFKHEPGYVPASSVLNQSFKYDHLPAKIKSPTHFANVLQPEGDSRLMPVQSGIPQDSASRNVIRDLDAFEGGSNFGTTMTNLIRGLAYGEADYIDAAATRGEDVLLNMIIDPEDMLLAQPYLDRDQSIHATRARRAKLHTIIQATRNPNFNGGEHYDVMREQNPRAFQMLENLGYTKDTFENAISATDFNFRMQYPLMRQRVERIRALDPQMQGAGEFFREMGMRHFIEDPLGLTLALILLVSLTGLVKNLFKASRSKHRQVDMELA